ncbi:hypothetical protein BO86DRAFT_331142 [Aspergillus japonicus CBS 114.51]|uniref:Translation initiation factor 5A C-terminal domain-containing protein n=1 Tax=Aspergillus japonicus CBS 114.51 TaxID=1448312 RepID=A0A8T8XCJ9_ASPJA|nr:hypothetical protein BO86DRAFT_331142 [Aspergillus japonicus CBS 114.51]RAH85750.1 hypothetical protein BO86DRAFT_331142 [Aspergillus japonicus CBS 114.51]
MATGTYSMQASALRAKQYALIDGRPCQIIRASFSNDECHLEVKDLFLGNEFKATFHQDDNVEVPNVDRTEYSLVNIDDGMLNLMAQDGNPKDDLSTPNNDLGTQIKEDFESGKEMLG